MGETIASSAEVLSWDASLPKRRVRLDVGTIVYTDIGSGPPVLFIHGYGDELFTWRYQLRELRTAGHLYALDLIGHGFSDKPAALRYDAETFVRCVYDFMRCCGLERATLVGSAMGAATALCLAKRYPDCVQRVALLGPTIPGVQPAGRFFTLVFWLVQHGRWGELLLQPGLKAAVRMALREAVADATLITDEIVRYYAQFARAPGFKPAYVATARHWDEWQEQRPHLGELHMPVLAIWGEQDRVHPVRQAGLLRTLIPQLQLVRLPQCGHLPHIERPEQVNRALRAFLTSASPA